jgi:hypothetical protein
MAHYYVLRIPTLVQLGALFLATASNRRYSSYRNYLVNAAVEMLVTFWINPKENEEVYGGKNRKGGGALDNKKGKNFREGKRATQVVSNVRSARKNSRAAFFKSPQCRRTLFRLFCKFGHSAAPPVLNGRT